MWSTTSQWAMVEAPSIRQRSSSGSRTAACDVVAGEGVDRLNGIPQ
jgi:hypothetical protein